jgi:hypothetical protein
MREKVRQLRGMYRAELESGIIHDRRRAAVGELVLEHRHLPRGIRPGKHGAAGAGVRLFKGIPFAEPPLGKRRFAPPAF